MLIAGASLAVCLTPESEESRGSTSRSPRRLRRSNRSKCDPSRRRRGISVEDGEKGQKICIYVFLLKHVINALYRDSSEPIVWKRGGCTLKAPVGFWTAVLKSLVQHLSWRHFVLFIYQKRRETEVQLMWWRPVNHLVAPPLKRPLLYGLCDSKWP